MKLSKIKVLRHKKILKIMKISFWFSIGALLGIFLLISFSVIIFKKINQDKIYPGVMINGVDFGGQKEEDLIKYFKSKNEKIKDTIFTLSVGADVATISAKDIDLGYDANLLATQAYGLGRSKNTISDFSIIVQAYLNRIHLSPAYSYSDEKFTLFMAPLVEKTHLDPVESLFNFQNGRVTEFKPSKNGQDIDVIELKNEISSRAENVVLAQKAQNVIIKIPIKITEPNITTEKANNMGIKELIGRGSSLYQHSIPGRIHNVNLAASRMNGVLIAPDEVFSFNKVLGDVSAFTGYKQAYIISGGRTILGDGGGVCQVSTTLFRAFLDAGLPIIERHAHSYRVGYYEQDSLPGIDATVYSPTVDLKFKNDTGHHILIQTFIDPSILSLRFDLYGTSDGRITTMTKPVITSSTPPLPDVHQDDPTLPKGQVKQVDFAAAGAKVYFTRKVTRNGEELISETFYSNFRPWQAVFLHGTKEN